MRFSLLQTQPIGETVDDGSNFYLFLIIALVVVALAMVNRRVAVGRNRDSSTWYWLGAVSYTHLTLPTN